MGLTRQQRPGGAGRVLTRRPPGVAADRGVVELRWRALQLVARYAEVVDPPDDWLELGAAAAVQRYAEAAGVDPREVVDDLAGLVADLT